MDGVIVGFGFMIILGIAGTALLALAVEGTKGIERQPYYGRKTGIKYTAKKTREEQII